MKKIGLLCMSLLCIVGLSGCRSGSSDNPAKIIESRQLRTEWDDIKLFWMCSFDGMHMTVTFNQDDPQVYFAEHSLTLQDIKTIQVYPDQSIGNQFIYIIYKDGIAQVDEQDLKDYQDKGHQEAYDSYQKKIEDLDLTTKDIGKWIITYFNENVRQELISQMRQKTEELKQKIGKSGYSSETDDKDRFIISSLKGKYKIVIDNHKCMIVDGNMDLSGGKKTGYMYTPQQGTVGYISNDQTKTVYRYKDNKVLEGTPTLNQYNVFKDMKKWYDDFLVGLDTDLTTLSTLS